YQLKLIPPTGMKDNYSVAGNNADEYEKLIADTEAEIKELEGKIEIQTEIVELAKKRVEAYIAAQK
ncbi:conserved domain protein, partial [Bacteroides fluxus YIT 12057]